MGYACYERAIYAMAILSDCSSLMVMTCVLKRLRTNFYVRFFIQLEKSNIGGVYISKFAIENPISCSVAPDWIFSQIRPGPDLVLQICHATEMSKQLNSMFIISHKH